MSEDSAQLIVGLGNPGPAYRGTRHNIGFMVIDRLAAQRRISLNKEQFECLFGVGTIEGRQVILAQPMTFMNLSGPAVWNLARFFNLDLKHLLVVHDDIDIVFGKIKIKRKGGDGGHHGVRSLMEAWGSGAFTRLRIGIGRPQTRQETKAYVLAGFDAQQEALLEDVVLTARDAVETILFKGVPEAMNRFHGKTILERNVGRKL